MAIVNLEEFNVVVSIPMDCPSVLEGDIPIDVANCYFNAKISNIANHLWISQLQQAKLLSSLSYNFGTIYSIKSAKYHVHRLEFTIGGFKSISKLIDFIKAIKTNIDSNLVIK